MVSSSDAAIGDLKAVPLFFRWPSVVFGPVASALGGVALPLSVTPELESWLDWIRHPFWFVVSLAVLILGLAWSFEGARRRDVYTRDLRGALSRANDDALETFSSVMTPILHDLGNLADSQSVSHGRDLVNRSLGAIPKIIDVPKLRVCMYLLDHLESRRADSMDPPNALTLRSPHEGRFDAPRESFLRDQGKFAEDIFRVIDSNEPRLIEDVSDPQHDLDCPSKEYETFLNVPVKFLTKDLGVLSIDAPIAKSLTKSHLLRASFLAKVIAVGILREKKNQSDRNLPQQRRVPGNEERPPVVEPEIPESPAEAVPGHLGNDEGRPNLQADGGAP
jgi:hypothetical protein